MADSRLPERLLLSPKFDGMSDAAWRVFTNALMWSNSQGTDGAIPTTALRYLHPSGVHQAAIKELEALTIWDATDDGWQLRGWADELGQSTKAYVDNVKEQNRLRAAAKRERDAAMDRKATKAPTFQSESTPHVTQKVRRTSRVTNAERTQDVGRKEGQAGRDNGESLKDDSPVLSWPVVAIPQGDSIDYESMLSDYEGSVKA